MENFPKNMEEVFEWIENTFNTNHPKLVFYTVCILLINVLWFINFQLQMTIAEHRATAETIRLMEIVNKNMY